MTLHTLGELQGNPDLLKVPERLLDLPAFRNCITLFSGREKIGKTTKLSQQIARASPHLRVLWLAIDEWKGFVVQRLTGSGADADLLIEDERLEVSALRELIGMQGIAIVVIDTLREFASGIVLDSSDDMQWTPLMRALRDIAQEAGIAIVLIHHNAKGSNDYSGSTAIAAGSDVLVNMKADPEVPTRRTFTVRARLPVGSYTEDWLEGDYVPVDDDPLANGSAPIEDRIVAYVARHPGACLNDVKGAIAGCRKQAIGDAVQELLKSEWLVDRGRTRVMELHVGAVFIESRRTPGDRSGIAPGIDAGITEYPGGLNRESLGIVGESQVIPALRERVGLAPLLEAPEDQLTDGELERLAIQNEEAA